MDALQLIKKPIESELREYRKVFDDCLVYDNPLLQEVLNVISQRRGKMMRPLLTLLSAKLLGTVSINAIYAAATFEFLHTASLVHDDIVDESDERRGQSSINNSFGNKVAVLVGDFVLSLSLLNASRTGNPELVGLVSKASQELASGELLQLHNIQRQDISEDVYFDIIKSKTAALFAVCAQAGAMSVGADSKCAELLRDFGEFVGICFQIRDDIFDYSDDSSIGKPTGNDMKEGKLTLPVIYALVSTGDSAMMSLANKVKRASATHEEIGLLIDFTKKNGGIDYARKVMFEYADRAKDLLCVFPDSEVRNALMAYVDFVVDRAI